MLKSWPCMYTSMGLNVDGQLRGDYKECPFSGVTSSGRIWRKVPKSESRSGVCVWGGGGGVCVCVWGGGKLARGGREYGGGAHVLWEEAIQ